MSTPCVTFNHLPDHPHGKGCTTMCDHSPSCPDSSSPACCTAHVVVDHSEQGWCRLCNGVILFSDGGYLTPDRQAHRLARSA